jgi:hypothetical protein
VDEVLSDVTGARDSRAAVCVLGMKTPPMSGNAWSAVARLTLLASSEAWAFARELKRNLSGLKTLPLPGQA